MYSVLTNFNFMEKIARFSVILVLYFTIYVLLLLKINFYFDRISVSFLVMSFHNFVFI